MPVWQLLGSESPVPVRCNATLVAGTPDEVAASAGAWQSQGFGTFKLKLGVGDDLRQVAAVRDARAGCRDQGRRQRGWSPADAIAIVRELEPLEVELVEEPTSGLRDMAAVAAATEDPDRGR